MSLVPMRSRPSELAVEAKKRFFPYILQRLPHWTPCSYVHNYLEVLDDYSDLQKSSKLRVAVIKGDPVDVALDWFEEESRSSDRKLDRSAFTNPLGIPVVNMANERQPGGDWESSILAPEENLCRRSNLVRCLEAPWKNNLSKTTNYPIPSKGGLYSPHVVVFRGGPDQGYAVWPEFKSLPVISVAPIRRPKLDASGQEYSFPQEKEVMKEKIRTVLRIAAAWRHRELCIGAFGAGPAFRNPVNQVATMWRDVLFGESEFRGAFHNVVFAIDSEDLSEYKAFACEFDASNVIKTAFR